MVTATQTASKTGPKAKKSSSSSLGAPSQRTQSSRKGKRAWRKNVDIDHVEEGLEEMRAEERVVGSALQKKTNDELFQVDIKGDDQVRKSLPRFSTSQLTSTKILNQRSAVPAVLSRSTPVVAVDGKRKLSYEEKGRLLRMGKRQRRGPLNSVIDPTELGAGSALMDVSEAVKQSGGYDVWVEEEVDEEVDGVMKKRKVKAPKLSHPRELVSLPPIVKPHQGTSYNPLASAHQELLESAITVEEKRVRDAAKNEEWTTKMERARQAVLVSHTPGVPVGMTVGDGDTNMVDELTEGDDGLPVVKKMPARKTKQQRRKAEKVRAERRALVEKAANRRFLASISGARQLRASLDKGSVAREKELVARAEVMREKLRAGLIGQKLGKHVVKSGELDVQLGEELTESLRELKPEGNLFRDRFLSLQHRGLVEPRSLVVGRKREAKTKEYEKHAWKRFQ